MESAERLGVSPADAFRHEALIHSGEAGFLAGTLPFIREGLEREEPVMVAVAVAKIDVMRSSLGPDSASVHWIDMAGIGRNPARIIPLWRQFVASQGKNGRVRGIGEPIWPERSQQELIESQHHEALMNVAFADARCLSILCPYDVDALEPAVIEAARERHPLLVGDGATWESTEYPGTEAAAELLDEPLPEPPPYAEQSALDAESPVSIRRLVSRRASEINLSRARTDDMALAAVAVADSLRRDGREGHLSIWHDAGTLVCELRHAGPIADPLAGREWPPFQQPDSRGLWVANQLCDLVQMRQLPTGTVVRLHMAT
jgi:hypothetical protein